MDAMEMFNINRLLIYFAPLTSFLLFVIFNQFLQVSFISFENNQIIVDFLAILDRTSCEISIFYVYDCKLFVSFID